MVTYDKTAAIPRSGQFRALVRAGESVTAYLRTGNGKPVILLRSPVHDEQLWASVLGQLSLGFRVIVPEVSPDPATLGDWFVAFHDGLGIGATSLVVDDSYAVAATRLVLAHGSRIGRLVFVSRGRGAGDLVGAISDSWSREAHPLLVMTDSEPAEIVAARVVEFLQAG